MNERIAKLVNLIFNVDELYEEPIPVEYDREDLFLPEVTRDAKRVVEYILHQEPGIMEYSRMVGVMHFDGSVMANVFHRAGHRRFNEVKEEFYDKPLHNLVTMEWQHSAPNHERIIKGGLESVLDNIHKSLEVHTGEDEILFLKGMETVVNGILAWADKCSEKAKRLADATEHPEYRQNLINLSEMLKKIPRKPAENFAEAIFCVSFCHSFCPDSIGLADRYLYPYYQRDLENGVMTREEAKVWLQDLFIIIQADVSRWGDTILARGGECHFSIGGYDENGNDSFNDLSKLILEAMLELPIYKPQISLRWTKKTPYEVFKYVMDCERNDPNKRIAFVNDEPRIRAFTEIGKCSFKDAVSYSSVGCNEVGFPGGMWMGATNSNIVRCLESTLYKRAEEIQACETYEAFYQIFEEELCHDMGEISRYGDLFNQNHAKDVSLLSCFLFDGCIENAKSITQGGADRVWGGESFMGVTTVIDSLSVIKQFVFEEKLYSMAEMLEALRDNWEGHEEMRNLILKKGKFFGNNDELSDGVARQFTTSIYEFYKDKKNLFGKNILVGTVIGYNEHHVWFGEHLKATPDGRYAGDPISHGMGQTEGKDKEGLTALLNSVSTCDPNCIMNGPMVTNLKVDEQLVKNDDNFEKLCRMLESYFKQGGVQFQLTYVSREELLKAKENPQDYKNLRVRVSGFSDYFVCLNNDLQDDIIKRTDVAG